ncbi:MAG: butyrate kinase [Chlorobi bacterium]|nr:butyrate kinase [Chlorobiota bacterium]
MSKSLILAINPRMIYTKLAVYRLEKIIFLKMIRHTEDELKSFENIPDQEKYRTEAILKVLKENEIALEDIIMVMGRGGLVRPVISGIFPVNEALKKDLRNSELGDDVVNLGGLIASRIADQLPRARAYIADPVVVDEFDDIARISGHPLFARKSVFHALNQKYVARLHARSLGKKYEDLNLIVVNLGGGITVGAHSHGKVVDATYGYDGDGPFSPISSGQLPIGDVIRACFSGKYSEDEMLRMIRGDGGLYAYLGTHSGYEVQKRIDDGDEKARFIFEAMAYQIAKEVGAMCMVFKEPVDAILVTGPMANSKTLMGFLMERLPKIAQVHIYPGDDELDGLAYYGYMFLKGEIDLKDYPS